jgi:ribosomal-protein-serine acetyltransferase
MSVLTALPLFYQGALQLAPLQISAAVQLWPLIAANKTNLAQFLPWAAAVVDEQSTADYLQSRITSSEPGAAWWLLLYQGQAAGVFGLKAIRDLEISVFPGEPVPQTSEPALQVAEIGYWLGAAFRGRQLIPQLLQQLGRYLYHQQLAHWLEFRCLSDNHASIRLVTKAGAVYCGSIPHSLSGHFQSQQLQRYLLWLGADQQDIATATAR